MLRTPIGSWARHQTHPNARKVRCPNKPSRTNPVKTPRIGTNLGKDFEHTWDAKEDTYHARARLTLPFSVCGGTSPCLYRYAKLVFTDLLFLPFAPFFCVASLPGGYAVEGKGPDFFAHQAAFFGLKLRWTVFRNAGCSFRL